MGDWNGTIPTFKVGPVPAADLITLADVLSALTGAWTAWTPTLTNLTQGSGTITARYRRIGKTVDYRFKFLLGAGSAVGTGPTFTLPVTPATGYVQFTEPLGIVQLRDEGTANRDGVVMLSTTGTNVAAILSYSTTGVVTTITSTVPHTWASTDAIACYGTYEVD